MIASKRVEGIETKRRQKMGLNGQHLALSRAKTWRGTFIKHVEGNDKVRSCGEFKFQLSILGGYTNLSRNDRKEI